MTKNKRDKIFNSKFILLMIVSLITALAYTMFAPLVSVYVVELGASLKTAGLLTGVFSIAALGVRPFSGVAADRFNKKRVMIIATLLLSVASIGYAVSVNITLMFFFRILHGIAFGISGTANVALMSECIPKKRLGEGIGYFGLGQVLSQVIGPNIGVYIKENYGFTTLFGLIIGLTMIGVLILSFIKYGKKVVDGVEKAFKFSLKNLIAKECILYAAIGTLFAMSNGIVNTFMVLVGEKRNIAGIAIFFSVNAAILFLIRMFLGRFVDKANITLIVNLSLGLAAISMFLISGASTILIIIIAAMFKAFGQGGGQIALQAAAIKKVDATRVGIATSTYYIGLDIGNGLGPIIGGVVSDTFSYSTMYFSAGVLMVITMLSFTLYQYVIIKKRRAFT